MEIRDFCFTWFTLIDIILFELVVSLLLVIIMILECNKSFVAWSFNRVWIKLPIYSILFRSIPFHPILFYSDSRIFLRWCFNRVWIKLPIYSIVFHSIPFHFIPSHPIPSHPILFYSILIHAIFAICFLTNLDIHLCRPALTFDLSLCRRIRVVFLETSNRVKNHGFSESQWRALACQTSVLMTRAKMT